MILPFSIDFDGRQGHKVVRKLRIRNRDNAYNSSISESWNFDLGSISWITLAQAASPHHSNTALQSLFSAAVCMVCSDGS